MPARHTRTGRGTQALALFRGGGRDGKCLARRIETSRLPTGAEPADRDLENEIGFCLLERTAKSVRLTDAGARFSTTYAPCLQQADEAVRKARAIASAEPTRTEVGYSPAATARILPPILRAYQRVMPKVHVKLYDWSNEENVAGLRDGDRTLRL